MKDVKLYTTESCPYCILVKDFIAENNIEGVEIVDVTYDAKGKRDVLMLGGKMQVPMLYVNETALYESKDIVEWLKNNM